MSIGDYLILGLTGLWFAGAVCFMISRRRRGKNLCGCGDCGGCGLSGIHAPSGDGCGGDCGNCRCRKK